MIKNLLIYILVVHVDGERLGDQLAHNALVLVLSVEFRGLK